MDYKCICSNGNVIYKSGNDCNVCTSACAGYGGLSSCQLQPTSEQKAVLGMSLALFLIFLIIQILLLIFMIWFSIHVLKRCNGTPQWLNPTVIALLILWALIGWFPGIGLLLFVALLVILIIYNNKCSKGKSFFE